MRRLLGAAGGGTRHPGVQSGVLCYILVAVGALARWMLPAYRDARSVRGGGTVYAGRLRSIVSGYGGGNHMKCRICTALGQRALLSS